MALPNRRNFSSDFRLTQWLPTLWVLAGFVYLLSPGLFEGDVPAFRDTIHFYYPTWQYLSTLPWHEQCIPSWNSLQAMGGSWIADPTTMAFYPPRFLLANWGCSMGQRIAFFLLFHLVLAYASGIGCGRVLGLTLPASQLASAAYTLSGPVFFQIYNPIYLVSAAWLPLMAMALNQLLHRRKPGKSIVLLASTMAMTVLGGDVQMVYHLIIVGMIVLIWQGMTGSWSLSAFKFAYFMVSCLFSFGLSSVQILPSFASMGQSDRANADIGVAFDFSVAPWHWLTLVVPHALGSYVQDNTRWIAILPAEGRIWVSSLHVGVIPFLFLLLMSCHALRGHSSKISMRNSWAILLAVAVLSSSGAYSLLWLLRQLSMYIPGFEHVPNSWSDVVSSVQGIWFYCIPGYSFFRYPAKWLPWAMLALAFAAGGGWDRLRHVEARQKMSRLAAILFVIASVLLTVALFTTSIWEDGKIFDAACSKVSPDPWCGTLNSRRAASVILNSGLHVVVVCGLVTCLSLVPAKLQCQILVHAAMIEIIVLASHQTCFVHETCIRDGRDLENDRLCLSIVKQREAWLGRLHLLEKQPHLFAQFSIEPGDLKSLRDFLDRHDTLETSELLRYLGWEFNGKALARTTSTFQPRWVRVLPWMHISHSRNPLDSDRWNDLSTFLSTNQDANNTFFVDSLEQERAPIAQVKPTRPLVMHWSSSHLVGIDTDRSEDERTLAVPIYPSAGWEYRTNKKSHWRKPMAASNLWMVVTLPAEESIVELRYRTPNLVMGMAISLISWLFLFVCLIRTRCIFQFFRSASG